MKPFLWIWGIFSFGWTFWNLWGYHQKNEKFSAALSLRKPIFTHPVLDSEPVTLSSQPHSSWLMSWQWFCAGTPSTQKKKERKKNPKLAFPPPRLCLLGGGGKLTKLTLFFPACGCQVGQFPVFLRQLELAVIKARSPSEALLGQTPVRGQQHLPVKLELLKLWGERKTISVKLADIFPSYMQRLSWQPAHEQLCSHSTAQNSESIWAMTHLLQFCLRLWLWCV